MNPQKRAQRAARAALLRGLVEMESDAIKAGDAELAATIIGGRDLLRQVADSNRTGAGKDRIFKRVVREIKQRLKL